jgi:phage terminase small subunit
MSPVVATAIAAISAAAAVVTLFVYLYVVRRSDLVAAREEALALAETRRQVIHELRGRLKSTEERQRRAKAYSERRIRELQAALDRTQSQARKEAYQTQHFYAVALADLSKDLLADLERTPPDIAAAVARIRKLLTAEPHNPRLRTRKPTGRQN